VIEQQQPKFAHQPGRRKFARPVELLRAMRSKSAMRRPVCAACGQIAPAPDRPRDDWLERWSHCMPLTAEQRARGVKRGDPCPSRPMLRHEYDRMQAEKYYARFGELPPGFVTTQLALFPLPEDVEQPVRKRRLVRVTQQNGEPRVSSVPPQLRLFEVIEEVVA
jgi:hypothetical protein